MSEHTRPRPRWAQAIHDLGDDLRWALSAWCDFPRPFARFVGAGVSAVVGWRLGLDDQLAGLIDALVDTD